VGLKKVPHKEVARGHCLGSAAGGCQAATHLIVRLEADGQSSKELRTSLRNKEVEVALGSWHGRAQLIYIRGADTEDADHPGLARLVFASPLPCFFGQPLAIIRHGSGELLHGARILWCGDISPARRKALHALLRALPEDLAGHNPATLQLGLNGYAPADRFDAPPAGAVQQGEWMMSQSWLAQTREAMLAALQAEPLSGAELAGRLRIDPEAIQPLLLALKAEQRIRLHHDKWQPGSGESEDDLGEEALLVLKLVRDQGKEGYQPGKLGPGGVEIDPVRHLTLPAGLRQKGALQKQLRNLARLTYLIQLEGPIYYDAELYHHMVRAVLAGQRVGDLIDMGSLKEITGLSRKYAIPFCLRMEMDGWVRREDNDRRVLRLPEGNPLADETPA
jgi:selenocysteine-specific elongation factor